MAEFFLILFSFILSLLLLVHTDGLTGCTLAAQGNHHEVVARLAVHGCSVHVDESGITPLQRAFQAGSLSAIKVLAASYLDSDRMRHDMQHLNPLQMSAEMRHWMWDRHGREASCLSLAAECGMESLFRAALFLGVDAACSYACDNEHSRSLLPILSPTMASLWRRACVRSWVPSTNVFYGPAFRHAVSTIMLVSMHSPRVPQEMFLLIISFLRRSDFCFKVEGSNSDVPLSVVRHCLSNFDKAKMNQIK
jgi:hypothetical protein